MTWRTHTLTRYDHVLLSMAACDLHMKPSSLRMCTLQVYALVTFSPLKLLSSLPHVKDRLY